MTPRQVDVRVDGTEPIALDDRFIQDPHQLYPLLRAQAPVRKVRMMRGLDMWLVTRYDDARAALADARLGKDFREVRRVGQAKAEQAGLAWQMFDDGLTGHMLSSDPPQHERLRRLVTKAFTARAVAALRPRIEQLTDELLDAMQPRDSVELLAAFAFPLPVIVICELLGVPQQDRDRFRAWSNALLSIADESMPLAEAGAKMAAYLRSLVADKRRVPGEDLLSGLVGVRDNGDRLDEHELVSMAFLLLVAGHETTVNLIGNGVLALLRNPDQLAALRADPGLLPGAVEELLRYEGPVNIATMRFTKEAITLGGQHIPADEFVMVALASANRDPDRFADPDTVDLTRPATGHVAFGHGIHHCLGAPLARMEGQIAIGRLLDRFPNLALAAEPDDDLVWRTSTLMRGLRALPVRLR